MVIPPAGKEKGKGRWRWRDGIRRGVRGAGVLGKGWEVSLVANMGV